MDYLVDDYIEAGARNLAKKSIGKKAMEEEIWQKKPEEEKALEIEANTSEHFLF